MRRILAGYVGAESHHLGMLNFKARYPIAPDKGAGQALAPG